ncbi:metalloprotease RseP [Aerococcus urinaehominis]|uniref:Zinc metalloprotease n=1 Tax=Aerococcus urinaehominis TaxID=128944 RepID=A0A0X8FLH7_9LACT|nr:RIP metalloprotease RseP [Aerococcus urinaehominis]AMB98827.1 metalloprotease RseP [Aerococcus urinaehominis]SDM48683.1 regulator of sigma E protease [Aerococcus urinaehominis]
MQAIIAFIFIFCLIVIIHEFGHFYFAKRAGILVREFAIGMGPKLFSHRGQETTYTVRMLPLGGYVRMAGMEEMAEELAVGQQILIRQNDSGLVNFISMDAEANHTEGLPLEVHQADLEDDLFIAGIAYGDSQVKKFHLAEDAIIEEVDGTRVRIAPRYRQFQAASLGQRMMVNFAGPMNNFILAIVTFIILAFVQGGVMTNQPVAGEIVANSPAQAAGLQAGDQLLAVDGQDISSFDNFISQVQASNQETIDLTIDRNGSQRSITVTPDVEQGQNGQTVKQIGVYRPKNTSFWAKIAFGFSQTWAIITGIFAVFKEIFTTGFNINYFGGPVYMYQATSQVVGLGFTGLLSWLGALSVNLGIVNLLPIPALDGGKLVFNVIEGIRGKPVSEKTQSIVSLIGVALVFILMVMITWNDILRLFG